jgi:tetratricopeptide (TPR) repeat protein
MTTICLPQLNLPAAANAVSKSRVKPAGGLPAPTSCSRRSILALTAAAAAAPALSLVTPRRAVAADDGTAALAALQAEAASAFAAQDFATAEACLSKLIALDSSPRRAEWLEGRAQVRVDAKRFKEALEDFDAALSAVMDNDSGAGARLHAGRALAHEGMYQWEQALGDYNVALEAASKGGFKPDPYVLNSRGNVYASLARWDEARQDYLASAAIFQSSQGYRRGASTTSRLDGAIYAASNAALMRAQLGDDAGAEADLAAVARRAPNSADARAARAALLWALGKNGDAESAWESACARAEGCRAYRDLDYVGRIRRWPPRMVEHLRAFLELRAESKL